jgi:Polyketide cyclase / dehydrase and lipid transport
MSACKRQALLEAPVESIWDLVGNPSRHPEWWPRVIEVHGERFDPGDEYIQVTRGPIGATETKFLVERLDDLREVRISCQLTGTYAHWVLTGAQGGTFVDVEMGMDPKSLGNKVFDVTLGQRFFRRWTDQSLHALGQACTASEIARGAAGGA